MKTTADSALAIIGVSCYVDTFVVRESEVLQMNTCLPAGRQVFAGNPTYCKSAKRYP